MFPRDWILQARNLRVTANMCDAEETLGIIAPFPVLCTALSGQEGWRLGEDSEDPKHYR